MRLAYAGNRKIMQRIEQDADTGRHVLGPARQKARERRLLDSMYTREAVDGFSRTLDVLCQSPSSKGRLGACRFSSSWHNMHNTLHNGSLHRMPPPPLLVSEADLREAVRRELIARASVESGRVCEEFALERGAARIDLAVVASQLEGFELKSDRDSFVRLAEQMHTYNRVFDRITLVTGGMFEDAARALMPQWWGLIVARHDPVVGLRLTTLRPAAKNPVQDAHSLAMLLWREEALGVLALANDRPPRSASRAVLHERLATLVPLAQLRAYVLQCLHARFGQSAVAANTR